MGKNRLGSTAYSLIQELPAVAVFAASTKPPDRPRPTADRLHVAANANDNAVEGSIICSRDDRILSVNRAFTWITGFDAAEAQGQTLDILNSAWEPVTSHFEIYLAVREQGYWRGNLWSRRKNGENYVQTRSVSVVRNAAGQTTHFIIVFSDIWHTWHTTTRSLESRIGLSFNA